MSTKCVALKLHMHKHTHTQTHAHVHPAPLQDRALQAGIADCYEQGLVRAIGVSNYGGFCGRERLRACMCGC